MSVATSTCRSPFLKSASAWARRLALVAVDRHRRDAILQQVLDQAVGAVLHAREDEHPVPVVLLDEMDQQVLLISRPTGCTFCAISSAVWLRRATPISAGAFRRRSAMPLTPSLKVAEKSRLCFFCGSTASTS
jgi:hypothetical protein